MAPAEVDTAQGPLCSLGEVVTPVDVKAAVERDLASMPASVRTSGLADTARILASRLAAAGDRDTPPLARELRQALADLREMAGVTGEEADPLDDLEQRRNRRKEA